MRIEIDHNGVTYSGEVMRIKSTTLGGEDHGIQTAYLMCEGKGTGVGVGGYGLDEPVKIDGKFSHRQGTAYGMDHIMTILETAGVDRWEQLPGQDIVVLYEGARRSNLGSIAVGFAGLLNGKVMILKEHAAKFREENDGGDQ